ncbi:uncharacterized protein K452DRAFT_35561 [Aplosporella prunicola CBS 121167]|uniref:Uncharacterized protein n=1 Tax=Aplosporella prunicola CBS 121167 TaxID=1176127 RepID=A0A6A6ATF0_9PEZI|nr:uncharacterized protein K452DRAFT_35561 [Aplosporella prunicola CBS 121167]KAF2135282.1 hypothetical protein K452DRAFT_35561 [Aplosporella prunicola CBS 121167]
MAIAYRAGQSNGFNLRNPTVSLGVDVTPKNRAADPALLQRPNAGGTHGTDQGRIAGTSLVHACLAWWSVGAGAGPHLGRAFLRGPTRPHATVLKKAAVAPSRNFAPRSCSSPRLQIERTSVLLRLAPVATPPAAADPPLLSDILSLFHPTHPTCASTNHQRPLPLSIIP